MNWDEPERRGPRISTVLILAVLYLLLMIVVGLALHGLWLLFRFGWDLI